MGNTDPRFSLCLSIRVLMNLKKYVNNWHIGFIRKFLIKLIGQVKLMQVFFFFFWQRIHSRIELYFEQLSSTFQGNYKSSIFEITKPNITVYEKSKLLTLQGKEGHGHILGGVRKLGWFLQWIGSEKTYSGPILWRNILWGQDKEGQCKVKQVLSYCTLKFLSFFTRWQNLTLSSIYTRFNTSEKKALGKCCGKRWNCSNEQFHLFPQCFLCNLNLKILL